MHQRFTKWGLLAKNTVHVIWCWLDNHTNWNCHNLMKVPVWNTRNTNLSELCLSTVANVNKILKEREKKKKKPLVFLKAVLCSYLQFLALKLLFLTVFWSSPGTYAGSVRAAGSWCPQGPCSHKSDTPCWTPCMKECIVYFYKEDWLWCAKVISTYWRPSCYEKQKGLFSHHGRKKNNSLFFHSDHPVGIKIPPPRYRIQAFKTKHKDRLALLLSRWPSAPQTFMIW